MKLRFLALFYSLLAPCLIAAGSPHRIFIGTYTRTDSKGIYYVELDGETGALSTPTVAAEVANPPWLTFSPSKKFLYTVSETESQAVGFSIDPKTLKLTALPAGPSPTKAPACHATVDATGKLLITA